MILIDQRAGDLDLLFKPHKCVSYMFDGSKHLQKVIPLSRGTTTVMQNVLYVVHHDPQLLMF